MKSNNPKQEIKEKEYENENFANEININNDKDFDIIKLSNAIEKMNIGNNNITFSHNKEGNNLLYQSLKNESNSNSNSLSTSDNTQQPNLFNTNRNIIKFSCGSSYQNPIAQKINKDTMSGQPFVPKNIMNKNPKEFFPPLTSHLNPKGVTKDNIFMYLRDQTSTITLQREVMGADEKELDYLINEFKGLFRKILKNKNGNYLCSDLFKACSQEQRIKILTELHGTLSEDCLDNFATHPLQVLIDRANNEKEYNLILESFNDYNKFLFAALDSNGAFTIQKIIERIPEKFRTSFNLIFTSFISFISKKKFGVVVVKKFIQCTKSDDVTNLLMEIIRKDFANFAVDQYANYLISFLLVEWKDTPQGNEIKELVRNNFLWMCEKKYSSFICEKFIKVITHEEKKELINSIDLNELSYKLNNTHFAKIMKALGIYNNQNNINFQLPSNINNNFIMNDNHELNNSSRFDFVNNNNYYENNNKDNYNNIYNQKADYNKFPFKKKK